MSSSAQTARRVRAAGPPRPGTKTRLLDAAEQLFAERGFEGTSVRAVTRAADASVSAANYHFGSKQALVHAALVRRLEPLNRRRLEALGALEAAAGGGPVPVEELLAAFVRPGLDARRETSDERLSFRSVAAQLYTDPHAAITSLKTELFGPVIARFIDALARALPDRSREELVLDFQLVIGVMIHVISGDPPAAAGAGGIPGLSDEDVLQRVIAFTAAGLRSGGSAGRPPLARGESR